MSATEITSPTIEALQARLDELAHLDADATIATPCWKCGGRGYGGWPVDGGRCWNCNATGSKTRVVRNVRRSLKADITVERKSIESVARIAAEKAERQGEYAAANSDVVEGLAEWQGRYADDHFLADMESTLSVRGFLTEKQTEAARKALARKAEQAAAHAATEPVPSGRLVVTGEVVSTKRQESAYGVTYKMLVRDDRGWKVWGTIPSAIFPEKGDRVTFTATLERSADDHAFGFYSRPTKAELID